MAARRRGGAPEDPAARERRAGVELIWAHPLFAPFYGSASIGLAEAPFGGLARVSGSGIVSLHPSRRAPRAEWVWAIAHCLLHLGFEHHRRGTLRDGSFDPAWRIACCVNVNRLLAQLKLGIAPEDARTALPGGDEEVLARMFSEGGIPAELVAIGAAGSEPDLALPVSAREGHWEAVLASGLSAAVSAAVAVAGGAQDHLGGGAGRSTRWARAMSWFVSSYPLLGSLAAGLRLVEDAAICQALSIRVAAVSPAAGELYVNPHAGLEDEECRFVIGHELLHAGLRHDTRLGGRDQWLFNLACDYAINGWLYEMGVGTLPESALFDPGLIGMSAEEIYDRIAGDLRRYRRLATLRGNGLSDILPGRTPLAGEAVAGVDLDELYRRALTTGLEYHTAHGRGLVPAALEQEIRALTSPAIPWDVALANWFDERFRPLERHRSYSRPSRRQGATPDIPRPSWKVPDEPASKRTFGVVLDTSGSMGAEQLGKGLGAIASYAASRDVPAVRVVFCDAAAYDAGYMDAADIAGQVRVRGRGGTVLQPGVDLLQRAEDFPGDGPILVITDGQCDRVRIRRDHAFLVPVGARLPFRDGSPVFCFE
jgi:predicted metal-dependent peptidase